jgi:hypothetical protein
LWGGLNLHEAALAAFPFGFLIAMAGFGFGLGGFGGASWAGVRVGFEFGGFGFARGGGFRRFV